MRLNAQTVSVIKDSSPMSLACIHSSLQLRTCPGVSLRRSQSCTNTPSPFLISFLRQELTGSGDRQKTFWRPCRIPVTHDSSITNSIIWYNIGCQWRTLAHFLVSTHRRLCGFAFLVAGTASRSEGKYCRRRIRVEDDDASVTLYPSRLATIPLGHSLS